MRVLCIVPANIIHETEQFIGLKNKGADVHVVTCSKREPDYSRLAANNIPVHIVPLKYRIDIQGIKQLQRILAAQKFDIVHAFNNKTVSNGLIAAKNHPVKFIAYRGIVGNVSFFNPASWLTYLHPRVDRIICVAEAIRQWLLDLKFLRLKIPQHKLVTIYKGHDLGWYQKPKHDLSEFGVANDDFVVGCTTNFRPRKGIHLLVKAFDELPQELPIHLLLIGNMKNKKLELLIRQNKNKQRIHILGYRDNAPQIVAACDACILPSIKREGLPKTIIEGMAYGVPPIVTDSGGSPELIEDGISGIVVPSNTVQPITDAILSLYRNPDKKKSMGDAAKLRIRDRFTTQQTIDRTFDLYTELLNENK